MKSRLSAGFGMALALTLSGAAAATDFALDRTLRLDPGGKFSVDSDVLGGIVLVGDTESDARIRITAARDLNERYDIRFDQDAGAPNGAGGTVAKLTIERKGGWLGQVFGGGWGGSRARIEVHVPRSTSVDLRTSGGGIDISQLRGTAYLRTSGGGIDVLDVEGSVDASTSGGAVNVEQVRGEVVAESSGGGIFAVVSTARCEPTPAAGSNWSRSAEKSTRSRAAAACACGRRRPRRGVELRRSGESLVRGR